MSFYRRYPWLCWLAISKVKHPKQKFFSILIHPTIKLFNIFTLWLDKVIYPAYRNQKIDSPIFIIGYPRSGTTFLHRLLTETKEYGCFQLWQLIFPSILGQKIMYPLMKRIAKKTELDEAWKAHHTGPFIVEEEDVFFLFQCLDSVMLYTLTPMILAKKIRPDFILHDDQPDQIKKVLFFKDCVRRLLYKTQRKRLISKMSCGLTRIQSILSVFPDAKIIYVIRNPIDQITSTLSLVKGTNKNLSRLNELGNKVLGIMEIYYEYGLSVIDQIPSDKLLLIYYESIKNNLDETLSKIIEFAKLEISKRHWERMQEACEKQAEYKRSHQLDTLSDFAITESQIFDKFRTFFDRYGFIEERTITNTLSR